MEPVVRVEAGALRGAAEAGVRRFRGVPYAAPPVGSRFLAAPAPVEPWSGVRAATAPGPQPAQPPSPLFADGAPVRCGDDVLSLDITTPDPGACGLPVFVWIAIGGNVISRSADPVSARHHAGTGGGCWSTLWRRQNSHR